MYVDHRAPRILAPETTDPFEAVRYDHAGDLLMRRAAASASAGTGHDIVLHRNTSMARAPAGAPMRTT